MRGPHSLVVLLVLGAAAGCSTLEDWHPDAGVCDGGPCPRPDAGVGCPELNPQGCSRDADCGPAYRCVFDPRICRSSSCSCDRRTESWACVSDCAGGTCLPDAPGDGG